MRIMKNKVNFIGKSMVYMSQKPEMCEMAMLNNTKNHFQNSKDQLLQDQSYIEGGNENGKRCETIILDFFSLFIPNIMIGTFVTASNAYGRMFMSKYLKEDLTVSEFKAFLAIVIYGGLTKYPDRNLMFSTGIYGSQFIRNLMCETRFTQILNAWHYIDYTQFTAQQLNQNKAGNHAIDTVKANKSGLPATG
jgi:hypothetical protein